MVDSDGFRPNVGIILGNRKGQLFWARRVGQDIWQFPQGGICYKEKPLDAMYRELKEETGLESYHVTLMGHTRGWLRYRLPKRMVRRDRSPVCVGQKQIWYMLRLVGEDDDVKLDRSDQPEFDHWTWVNYWYPLDQVVFFKRRVYEQALSQFASLLGAEPRYKERANQGSSPAVISSTK